jgi:predicted RNase H-like HicB family nuclease
MTKKYTVLVERDIDGWFVSEVVGLPGCHTQAKSMDELFERMKEAIQTYFDDETIDEGSESVFVGLQHIEA